MNKLLAVIDMQTDFVDGALGTAEAVAILPAVKARIEEAKKEGLTVIFTLDTHGENYMDSREGSPLPVPHCIKGTPGWQLHPDLAPLAAGCMVFEKPTFGSLALAEWAQEEGFEEIELIGLCTDICVLSNALCLKAALPEAEVFVRAACCAGVTPASHDTALAAMAPCQIRVI